MIGREFPLSLVQRVVSQPAEELYRLLASLQRKEFLYEQPAFLEVEYIFKHALTQEVAYGSALQERRKALHEQTAQAIENLFSTGLDDRYEDLAHHYSRSGNTEKAVDYLHLAGQTGGAALLPRTGNRSPQCCPPAARHSPQHASTRGPRTLVAGHSRASSE